MNQTDAARRAKPPRNWLARWEVIWLACGVITQEVAQGSTYTNRSGFNAVLQTSTTITFESLTPSSSTDPGLSSVTILGVTITNSASRLIVCSPAANGMYPVPGDGQYIWHSGSDAPVLVLLPGGQNAFGASFSGFMVRGTLTVELFDGQSHLYNFNGPQDSWTFQGFVFPQPIRSVTYFLGSRGRPLGQEMLDDITFGVAVPEPGVTRIAAGSLILWLAASRHRQRRRER